MGRCAVIVVVACCAASCAIPVASIPARVEVGAGTALGRVPDRRGQTIQRQDPSHLYRLRAVGSPLQAIPPLRDRSFDVGVGYMGEFYSSGDGAFHHHGFLLEGSLFLEQSVNPLTGKRTRIGLIGSGELMVDDFSGITDRGSGLTAGVILERVRFIRAGDRKPSQPGPLRQHVPVARNLSPFRQGGWIGELGIGLTVTGSVRRFPSETYGVLMVSLSFRLPLGAGLVGLWPLRGQRTKSSTPVHIIHE